MSDRMKDVYIRLLTNSKRKQGYDFGISLDVFGREYIHYNSYMKSKVCIQLWPSNLWHRFK